MQFDLFHSPSESLPDCVELNRAFVSADEASALFQKLAADINWQQPEIKVYGKVHPIPRLQCWMGDVGYRYSGVYFPPEPWLDEVAALKSRIEASTGQTFNTCLLNFYRNGNDKMGCHADDEPELGSAPVIACVSLGAERCFTIKRKNDNRSWQLELPHGSLLQMNAGMQAKYLHGLPARKGITEGRISLTFRRVFE